MLRDRDLVPAKKTGISRGAILKGALAGLLLAFIVRLLVHGFWIYPYRIQTDEMKPELEAGETVYILRTFDTEELRRGQIVLIEVGGYHAVRRVAGLPGEQIQVHERSVFVNNRKLEAQWEARAQAANIYPGPPVQEGSSIRDFYGPLVLGENEIYVLADDRRNAVDSRLLGPISTSSVAGLVWMDPPK